MKKHILAILLFFCCVILCGNIASFAQEKNTSKSISLVGDTNLSEIAKAIDEEFKEYGVAEEYQKYVEDGTYEERVAFMNALVEEQNMNMYQGNVKTTMEEGATAKQSQIMPYGALMPSTGDVKALVFLVDFPDCKQTDGTTAEDREEWLFNLEDTSSFSGFYYASSYKKLKIDGDVFGYYTTMHNREHYNYGVYGRQELINELFAYYNDEIDYSDYDADKDGIIDALYIEYAGDDTGWGSFWWSYQGTWYDDEIELTESDGMNINKYIWIQSKSYGLDKAYKHETGHLLGLLDYYDSLNGSVDASLGTFDMMVSNDSDHNALSKILLGWIDPIEVSDETELELRSSQLYPEAAIVYPNNDKTSDEYFVLEYITGDGANFEKSSLLEDGGIRVWRVNTKLDESGLNYAYRNVKNEKKFIEAVGICNLSYHDNINGNVRLYDTGQITKANIYFEGDELTPYSTPSSYIYC